MSRDGLPESRLSGITIASRQRVHQGFVKLDVLDVDTMIGGVPVRLNREVHDHGIAASVFILDTARKTAIVVRQVRVGAFLESGVPHVLEAVAGLIDPGEDPETAVRREALEEAGVHLGALTWIGAPYASPGALTERVHLFIGEIDPAAPRAAGGGLAEEGEALEVLEVPLKTLAALSEAGDILDMKTMIMIETLRRRRPELFEG